MELGPRHQPTTNPTITSELRILETELRENATIDSNNTRFGAHLPIRRAFVLALSWDERIQTKETCMILIEYGAAVSGMLRSGVSGLLVPRVRCGWRMGVV